MSAPLDLDRLAQEAINDALARRKAAGQDLPEIAREIGVSRATLFRLKAGKSPLTLRTLGSLLRLINSVPETQEAA